MTARVDTPRLAPSLTAVRGVLELAVFGVLPVITLAYAAMHCIHAHTLGVDFRGEYFPEAQLVLHGHNPFPPLEASLAGGVNRIFPMPIVVLVAPLTLFSVDTAAILWVALLLVALGATLSLLHVRDWRVYGIVALWAPTYAALQTGNLTIVLGLLVAVAWRFRDRRFVSGGAIGLGIALKLYLWPLLVWCLALRRYREAALGAVIGGLSLLTVLPFVSLTDYARLINNLGNTFAPESYNVEGLLMHTGWVQLGVAKLAGELVGCVILAFAYRRRSLPLAIAAVLVLSPIVWLHYFEFLVIPLAIARPRLSVAWFLPLVMIVCPGTGGRVGEGAIVVGLLTLTAVIAACEWPPGALAGRLRSGCRAAMAHAS